MQLSGGVNVPERRYRIHWRAMATGYEGHGTVTFAKDGATEIANELNKEHQGRVVHWVEEAPPGSSAQ